MHITVRESEKFAHAKYGIFTERKMKGKKLMEEARKV